jgi:hypothetical protein
MQNELAFMTLQALSPAGESQIAAQQTALSILRRQT